jgi:hypothetical protein
MPSNDALVWIVPAVFTCLGVAYLAGRQTMALAQSKAQIVAIHHRFDEFKEQLADVRRDLSEIRDVMIARGYVEPGTNPGRTNPLHLK